MTEILDCRREGVYPSRCRQATAARLQNETPRRAKWFAEKSRDPVSRLDLKRGAAVSRNQS